MIEFIGAKNTLFGGPEYQVRGGQVTISMRPARLSEIFGTVKIAHQSRRAGACCQRGGPVIQRQISACAGDQSTNQRGFSALTRTDHHHGWHDFKRQNKIDYKPPSLL
jgi:hypothetical protein